jgi:uncharacterized protein
MTDFRDRLDALAAARRAARLAEVERLLAENPGRLLRASEMPTPEGAAPGAAQHLDDPCEPIALTRAPRRLDDLIGPCERIALGDGEVMVFTHEVPLSGAAERHPRGYLFLPEPARALPAPDALADAFALLANLSPAAPVPLERIAFLDTETTGIGGSAGTRAFLIGIGYFKTGAPAPLTPSPPTPSAPVASPYPDSSLPSSFIPPPSSFVVEQYFMEDYCHEAALLRHLAARLAEFEALVTFNGRNFDMPLVEARFIMNRMRPPPPMPHLDLLHPARRLWRGRFGSCSLSAIEQNVLAIARTHDVPGSLIPSIYFECLRTGDSRRLVPVLDHNVQDIVSMGALLLHMMECAADPDHERLADAPHELAALGRLMHKRGRLEDAAAFLERAATCAREPDLQRSALAELAGVYRRAGRPQDAADIWEAECARHGAQNPHAFIELAKIMEHRLRDLPRAVAVIDDALRQIGLRREMAGYGIGAADDDGALTRVSADLESRRERLRKRLARRESAPQ